MNCLCQTCIAFRLTRLMIFMFLLFYFSCFYHVHSSYIWPINWSQSGMTINSFVQASSNYHHNRHWRKCRDTDHNKTALTVFVRCSWTRRMLDLSSDRHISRRCSPDDLHVPAASSLQRTFHGSNWCCDQRNSDHRHMASNRPTPQSPASSQAHSLQTTNQHDVFCWHSADWSPSHSAHSSCNMHTPDRFRTGSHKQENTRASQLPPYYTAVQCQAQHDSLLHLTVMSSPN